jgi:hypothetical protein
MRVMLLVLLALGLLVGCANNATAYRYNSAYRVTPAATASTEIFGGRRERLSDLDDWEIDISVSVRVDGPDIGFAGDILTLRGPVVGRQGPSETYTLFAAGAARGYPMTYRAEIEYKSLGADQGEVRVVLTVADVSHRSYGVVLYRATHSIDWRSNSKQ